MRKRILWLLFLFFGLSVPVQAADLETTIRLESQKVGANPLPVLILIKTKTLAVENQININVANGWTISSNVNVSTSGLPTGVTPLPGIANGNGVGQIINFSCGDLSADTLYGFYITSGISINPSVGNKTWIVSTHTDTIKVNVPIVSSDQVVVTGKVGALASDFQIGISADKNSDLNIDDVVNYEITYGSYLPTITKPLIISGNWSRGTVVGSPTPSVDILDYVIGSGLIFASRQPVKGKIIKKTVTTESEIKNNLIEYQGKKLSFKHLNKFLISEIDNKIELQSSSGTPQTIVITLNPTNALSVEDVSGVKMRQIKKSDYQEETINWNNISGPLFVKRNPYELTVFFLVNKKSLTMAMVANSNDEANLRKEFIDLLNSIKLNP